MTALAITGIGAVTPVGLSAAAAAAALRAGVARLGPIASSPGFGADGELLPALGGRVPLEVFAEQSPPEWPGHRRWDADRPLPDELYLEDGPQRLVDLAVPAAREALGQAGLTAADGKGLGLFLGLDESDDAAAVLAGLVRGLGLAPAVTRTVQSGRAAGLEAIHWASESIRRGEISVALAGGVDSLVRPSVFARLDRAEQLASEANPQGIRPGEAAAFLVLTARPAKTRWAADLVGSGLADEPTAGSEKPCQAVGLCAAIRDARRRAPAMNVRPLTICDLNGDRYRALEWGLAMIRALADLTWRDGGPGTGEFWHPADCTGDTGAAAGALCCVWAVEALRKSYAQGDKTLVWSGSDGPRRVAVILSAAK